MCPSALQFIYVGSFSCLFDSLNSKIFSYRIKICVFCGYVGWNPLADLSPAGFQFEILLWSEARRKIYLESEPDGSIQHEHTHTHRLIFILLIKAALSPFPIWAVGYSNFHNLMGFTSKKMPNNILYNVCKKCFSIGLSHFLRICILLFPKNTHICTPWPQIFFCFFFNIWV